MNLSFQSVRVGPHAASEEGMLVTDNGSIVAVLSRVPHVEDHGLEEGDWYIECGFPDEVGRRDTFHRLEDVADWIYARLRRNDLQAERGR